DAALNQAKTLIKKQFPEYEINRSEQTLILKRSLQGMEEIRQATIEQTMTTLRNRVNELGIAEAIVQQQGPTRISVDLPGIQEAARAQEILGGTATLEFRLVDPDNTPAQATQYDFEGRKIFLKNQVILTGSSITDASAGFGEDGRATVNVRLGGGGESAFYRITGQNVGQLLAIVYVETKVNPTTKIRRKVERVIQVATIKSALPANFQISGLTNPVEAQNISLLLRAGALPASIDIIEQRTLGPKLGAQNIQQGVKSILIGLGLLILFVTAYYRTFGFIANIGLFLNLLLLVAILSSLGMTLTMSGIAGIVLTIGMAIDANVLIFERIREEMRNGMSIQASIHAGYERAFTTIIDSNVTTLLIALVLFGIGTGSIKGFAVTLSLGLITSMFTSIVLTRALVNAIYGGRTLKHLSIGI
ncbi:MAG: protein translocase subunit SecD, partial [Gammaproteobacteria bacterium]